MRCGAAAQDIGGGGAGGYGGGGGGSGAYAWGRESTVDEHPGWGAGGQGANNGKSNDGNDHGTRATATNVHPVHQSEDGSVLSEGWYVVTESLTRWSALKARGRDKIDLILANGTTLKVFGGIQVSGEIAIHGQPFEGAQDVEPWRLSATGSGDDPGIGSCKVTINGGIVTANGDNGAGIGGGANRDGEQVREVGNINLGESVEIVEGSIELGSHYVRIAEKKPREMDPIGVCSWSWHEPMTNIIRRMEANGFKGIQLALSPWVWEGEGSAAQKETFGDQEGEEVFNLISNKFAKGELDIHATMICFSNEDYTPEHTSSNTCGFYYGLTPSAEVAAALGTDDARATYCNMFEFDVVLTAGGKWAVVAGLKPEAWSNVVIGIP